LRQVNSLDYVLLIGYFLIVIAIGLAARRAIATSEDFFLSGRSRLGTGHGPSRGPSRA
jgi:Na+/proline symporter